MRGSIRRRNRKLHPTDGRLSSEAGDPMRAETSLDVIRALKNGIAPSNGHAPTAYLCRNRPSVR
jgi:hypothetical protein